LAGELYWEVAPRQYFQFSYTWSATPHFTLHRVPLPAIRNGRIDWYALDTVSRDTAAPPRKREAGQAIAQGMSATCVDTSGGYLRQIYDAMLFDTLIGPD